MLGLGLVELAKPEQKLGARVLCGPPSQPPSHGSLSTASPPFTTHVCLIFPFYSISRARALRPYPKTESSPQPNLPNLLLMALKKPLPHPLSTDELVLHLPQQPHEP